MEEKECQYCDDSNIAESLSFGITYCRSCLTIIAPEEFAGEQMYFWEKDDERKAHCLIILLTDEERKDLEGKALGLIARPINLKHFNCRGEIAFVEDWKKLYDNLLLKNKGDN